MSVSPENRPQVVSWNVTQACNLRCPHCYLGAAKRAAHELSTAEALSLIDELAALGPALAACPAEGLEVALQTSVLPMNHEEVPRIAEFAREKGVLAFNAYFLVCAGRGEELTDITPGEHEALLEKLIPVQARRSGEQDRFMARAKCAPPASRQGRPASAAGSCRGSRRMRGRAASHS